MWGTIRDKYLLTSIQKAFVSMSAFAKAHGLDIAEGPQLRDAKQKESTEPIPEVAGKDQLDTGCVSRLWKNIFFSLKSTKNNPKINGSCT